MGKYFQKTCIAEGCGKTYTTQNKKRRYCDDCIHKMRKERVLVSFRREVILPNGQVVFLTVKEQILANMLAMDEPISKIVKALGWNEKRVMRYVEGKAPNQANFPDVVIQYSHELGKKVIPKLIAGYIKGLEQVLQEKSRKDKLDWISKGFDRFMGLPAQSPEAPPKKPLTEQEKEAYLKKAKEIKGQMDKKVDEA